MKNKKINSGYYHEIMDRSHIILANIEDYILEQPGMTKEMKKLTKKATKALAEVYQLAGQEMHKQEELK